MTAEIVAPDGICVQVDRRIREIDTGRWSGLRFEEASTLYPREYAERERDLIGYRFPGGESFRDVRERVIPAFMEMIGGDEERVLVCGHKGANRVLLTELLGLPLTALFSIGQDYGCVHLIEVTRLPTGDRRITVTVPPSSAS